MPRKKKTNGGEVSAPTPNQKPSMEFYCVKQKKKVTAPVDQVVTTKNGRPMARAICPECGTKLNRFVSKNEIEGNGLLSGLFGFKSPFEGIPLLGNLI